jgi:hypothetical protein
MPAAQARRRPRHAPRAWLASRALDLGARLANMAMGGTTTDFKPGLEYLKRLDPKILRYSRDASYNLWGANS